MSHKMEQIWMSWNAAVLYHFTAFVFPLLKLLDIGIHILYTQLLTMEKSFTETNWKMIDLLSMTFQVQFKYMMQILTLNFNLEKRGIMSSTSVGCKLFLKNLIKENMKGNTEFLMWISNYCISCIFQYDNSKQKHGTKYYLTVFRVNTQVEKFSGCTFSH